MKMVTFVVKRNQEMNMLIAFDSLKGCLGSKEAGEAFASGVRAAGGHCRVLAMSDGGEGMLDAFLDTMGGEQTEAPCHDALMRPITARYGMAGETAIIEAAEACGLERIEPENRNPVVATSYGVGELMADAIERGARHCIVGLGGTATCDCGMGMLRAIIDRLGQQNERFDEVRARCFADLQVTIASDVTNPLCGPTGAASVFAPQKGATPEMIPVLELRAQRFADFSARHYGRDHSTTPGAGAAGGLGYALLEYFEAECQSGAELLLRHCRFDELLAEATLVVTGEGRSDCQTLMGKLPFVVMEHARKAGKPTLLCSGELEDRAQLLAAGFTRAESINPAGLPKEEAMRPEVAKANLKAQGGKCPQWLAEWLKTK